LDYTKLSRRLEETQGYYFLNINFRDLFDVVILLLFLKTRHGKRVKQQEESKRKKHFCAVQEKISKHNKKKGSSFWLAHNELSHAVCL